MNSPDHTKLFDIKKEALEAEKRIRKHIRETPVEHSPYLSQSGNCKVYLKLENLQLSGSFKLRGVMNKLLSLPEKERKIGLVTASSGNHGAAFAYALNKLGLTGTIYMPSIANEAKIEGLRYYDADLKFHGTDCVDTEVFARNAAEKNHLVYVPPYNDLKIIGGQATIGIELRRQIENINTVLVPVGGGGLISGIAGYLKSMDKNIEIIGCQPENSAVMHESIKAGKIVEMEWKPSLADAAAGGIEKDTITLDICKKYVDDFILVTEEEIKEGIKLFIEKHNLLIEGTGALPAASYLKAIEKFKNKNVILILSGARIGLDQLKEVLG
jgi:threonine dehydratase